MFYSFELNKNRVINGVYLPLGLTLFTVPCRTLGTLRNENVYTIVYTARMGRGYVGWGADF